MVAEIDLLKKDGTDLVKGVWRRHPITVHTGPKKNGIEPKAHAKFDDSKWDAVEDPALLKKPYGPGKFSMAWYRIQVTVPDKVGGVDVAGKPLWFRTTVDDYGEIWVDGKIDLAFGKSGRGAVSGFNTPNEVKLTDSAKPGQTFQIAVLAINSPFGNPPGNFIFFRAPTALRFYEAGGQK
jgi:gluconolactonase